MKLLMGVLPLGFFTVLLCAQNAVAPRPEIRGTVIESGTNRGVDGVAITLNEFVENIPVNDEVPKAITDSKGVFRIEPDRFGTYRIGISKEGYKPVGGTGSEVTLDKDHPSSEVRFSMARPAGVTGTVIDDETGKPLPNLAVEVERLRYAEGRRLLFGSAVITDTYGRFSATGLTAGDYVIATVSQVAGKARILEEFSEVDLKTVDRDYGRSYWPGGQSSDAVVPLPLAPGATFDAGTVRARKVDFYRVHVSIPRGICEPNESIRITQFPVGGLLSNNVDIGEAPCGKDFLLRNFAPGSYFSS